MKTTLELWSQIAFRISAFTLAGLLVVLTVREQNRPQKVDLQDAHYLEKMESYIKVEKARIIWAKPQIAIDQRVFRKTPRDVQSQKQPGGLIRS
jgi:hypothetical protein